MKLDKKTILLYAGCVVAVSLGMGVIKLSAFGLYKVVTTFIPR